MTMSGSHGLTTSGVNTHVTEAPAMGPPSGPTTVAKNGLRCWAGLAWVGLPWAGVPWAGWPWAGPTAASNEAKATRPPLRAIAQIVAIAAPICPARYSAYFARYPFARTFRTVFGELIHRIKPNTSRSGAHGRS